MNRLLNMAPAAAGMLAVAITGAATAQVAGTYAGATADGQAVSFTVGTDAQTGKLAITVAEVGFSGLCSDGSIFTTGFSWGGDQDILEHSVSGGDATNWFASHYSLRFSGDGQSATGTVVTYTTTLKPVSFKPKKSLFCTSASQSLGVSLQPGAKLPAPAKGTVVLREPSAAH